MDQTSIFQPFFAMIGLTFLVWMYMYSLRIPFINRQRLTDQQLIPHEFERLSPPRVNNPAYNLKNLFEMPVIFYAVILYLFVNNQVDTFYFYAAWLFVLFRIGHSLIHCTVNIILLRFALYAISSVVLWTMVARAALQFITLANP